MTTDPLESVWTCFAGKISRNKNPMNHLMSEKSERQTGKVRVRETASQPRRDVNSEDEEDDDDDEDEREHERASKKRSGAESDGERVRERERERC